jgi:hypothetical protein
VNENAKTWVAALRSGRFEQTTAWLHTPNGYCCLGVACELALDADIVKTRNFYDESDHAVYDGADTELPDAVVDWLGLNTAAGRYDTDDPEAAGIEFWGLTWDNDTGKSFDEIADIIEAEPPGLFR